MMHWNMLKFDRHFPLSGKFSPWSAGLSPCQRLLLLPMHKPHPPLNHSYDPSVYRNLVLCCIFSILLCLHSATLFLPSVSDKAEQQQKYPEPFSLIFVSVKTFLILFLYRRGRVSAITSETWIYSNWLGQEGKDL